MKRISLLASLLLCVLPLFVLPGASRQAVKARNGMVVSSEAHASAAGVEILKQGGNAIDAAVAVGFALAVTHPQAGNIGGGGFMVIRFADGRTTSFDYREKAPERSHRDMFLDSAGNYDPVKSQQSYWSAGVPGSVAGMLAALDSYGTRKRSDVIAPAIRLAEKGFLVDERFAADLNTMLRENGVYAGTKKCFGSPMGDWKEGDTLAQPDLAATLRRIMRNGANEFYRGETAAMLVRQMERYGGLITMDDLAAYSAVERPPVKGTYRGYQIVSMGPPSSGGIVLLQMLNLLEPYPVASWGCNSSRTIAVMTEAMKLAYADRAEHLGDPDFVPVPTARLISKSYADIRRLLIDTLHATPSTAISHGEMPASEREETTHYSVVDRWGNAVSVTTTINGWYGNGIVVEGAGFFLNNEMDDFSSKPGVPNMFGLLGGDANAIHPHKRMLSAMTPTIVVKDDKPFLITGSPGGSTIITTVLQTILNVIDHRMPLQEAVDAPRVHHQWRPDTLWYERRGLAADVVAALRTRGYVTLERDGYQGRVEAIIMDGRTGVKYGASDPRGGGTALGY